MSLGRSRRVKLDLILSMTVLSTMMVIGILNLMKYEKGSSTINNGTVLDVTEAQMMMMRSSIATEMLHFKCIC